MPRNLNDRVELFFPVETEEHIRRIKALLDLYLRDNVGAHMMQSNGTYRRVRNKLEPVSAQSTLYEMAQLAVTADKRRWKNVCSLYSAADNSAALYLSRITG